MPMLPPRCIPQPTVNPLYDGAPLRLVLSFLGDVDVDVADLVPPLLQQYTARLRMELSNLQVLEAADMDVLQAVEDAIKERTGEGLGKRLVAQGHVVRRLVCTSGKDSGRVLCGGPRSRAEVQPEPRRKHQEAAGPKGYMYDHCFVAIG